MYAQDDGGYGDIMERLAAQRRQATTPSAGRAPSGRTAATPNMDLGFRISRMDDPGGMGLQGTSGPAQQYSFRTAGEGGAGIQSQYHGESTGRPSVFGTPQAFGMEEQLRYMNQRARPTAPNAASLQGMTPRQQRILQMVGY